MVEPAVDQHVADGGAHRQEVETEEGEVVIPKETVTSLERRRDYLQVLRGRSRSSAKLRMLRTWTLHYHCPVGEIKVSSGRKIFQDMKYF